MTYSFSARDRDVFVRRMRRYGASWSHHDGRMQAIGMMVGNRWTHLTFSDREEDYGRVWLTTMNDDGSAKEVRWVDGNIDDWFHVFRVPNEPAARAARTPGGPR